MFFLAGCPAVLTSMFGWSETILGGSRSFPLNLPAIKSYWSIGTIRLKLLKCTSYRKVAGIQPYEPFTIRLW